jgi:hypothetical protein
VIELACVGLIGIVLGFCAGFVIGASPPPGPRRRSDGLGACTCERCGEVMLVPQWPGHRAACK